MKCQSLKKDKQGQKLVASDALAVEVLHLPLLTLLTFVCVFVLVVVFVIVFVFVTSYD